VRRAFRLILNIGCQYVLAVVFLMAAITKITDLPGFADQLLIHSDLPSPVARVVAAVLPWLELTCGACLALGYAKREAAVLLAILLVGLLVYSLTHLGPEDCGCFLFPVPTEHFTWWPPVRNGLLLLGAIYLARSQASKS
jgi:uncharacterized membrane protein YphA (DoxX/SURF4 family)